MTDQANYMTAAATLSAAVIGASNGKEVLDRIRESEHATEADLIEFAEVFLDGKYREQKEGAFARLFERMLREGGGVIAQEVEAVEKERRDKARETADKILGEDPFGTFGQFFGEDFADFFGLDDLDDEDESTPS
jgi:hypothetical protein